MTKTNSMPAFAVYKNKVLLGQVNGVSHAQAMARAVGKFGRCELIAIGNVPLDRKARTQFAETDMQFSHGRTAYPTDGFAERRAAEIAAWKARG
jgi:hypothetical protein